VISPTGDGWPDQDHFASLRGRKAVETRQIQEETNQANAAGPDFDADHMERHHEPV
jgi:hypothetical protein